MEREYRFERFLDAQWPDGSANVAFEVQTPDGSVYTAADLPAVQILGEHKDLAKAGLVADVVVDLILGSGAQAELMMEAAGSL